DMDSIAHLAHKLLQDRARDSPQQQTLPETAPPPYSESDMDSADDEDEEDDDESDDMPVKLTINAAHRIQGSNNLVPTSSTSLTDTTKFTASLLHTVNQINAANSRSAGGSARALRRPLKIDLAINCGLEIIGDRNVVGAVGVKPRATVGGIIAHTTSAADSAAVAGAKRKAED
ncbi:hypothetical protein DOTSEDRAFT_104995, partial [Dothistroma septosporum NZE10]